MSAPEPPGVLQCPDCQGAVSRLAAACPHCGRPGERRTQLIEQTGKGPKLMQLSGSLTCGLGLLLLVAGPFPPGVGFALIPLGIAVYFVGRAIAWWKHE